jgi:hypothetical protein
VPNDDKPLKRYGDDYLNPQHVTHTEWIVRRLQLHMTSGETVTLDVEESDRFLRENAEERPEQ